MVMMQAESEAFQALAYPRCLVGLVGSLQRRCAERPNGWVRCDAMCRFPEDNGMEQKGCLHDHQDKK